MLLRFREYEFAIMADVESMYQVLLPEADKNALRFLWHDQGQIKHFRMTRHIFGGVWSGSAAMYALRHVVKFTHPILCVFSFLSHFSIAIYFNLEACHLIVTSANLSMSIYTSHTYIPGGRYAAIESTY